MVRNTLFQLQPELIHVIRVLTDGLHKILQVIENMVRESIKTLNSTGIQRLDGIAVRGNYLAEVIVLLGQ